VGKTSLIKRYCEGYFTPNYKLTIGVDFAVKSLDWDDNTKITLQLWDVAGHERCVHSHFSLILRGSTRSVQS
jgi:Ras-related protein Rab-32